MTHEHPASGASGNKVLIGISTLVVLYSVACGYGWPQHGRDLVVAAHHDDGATGHELPIHAAEVSSAASESAHATHPHFIWVAPFVILLLCIAVLPLSPLTEHWWESNLHRFYAAAALGFITLAYYLVGHSHPIESHWPAHSLAEPVAGKTLQWGLAWTVFANAMLHEYIPFIVLLFSLYTISGGIRIAGNLAARPLTNTIFIAIGGLLASFIGTTGAAMLLIRPLLETNKERRRRVHTVVFFIFVVCNCGGCLLPIGDPPLFLGYLRGVDFLWTLGLWKPWLMVNLTLLVVYWAWDQFLCYPHERLSDLARDESVTARLRIHGLTLNGLLLVGVVLSVALLDPSKPIPGTHWHAPMFLREVVQLALVGISLSLGRADIRRQNHFNYHAILEVAALFFGIFICMQPALQILDVKGQALGVDSAQKFYWATGGLSAVLDNAPTYVVFFETARALNPDGTALAGTVIDPVFLTAISLGAVFLGAMTYIGNGPNFMVKAIAETAGVKMPSFFGYLKYSCLILLPVLALAAYLFL